VKNNIRIKIIYLILSLIIISSLLVLKYHGLLGGHVFNIQSDPKLVLYLPFDNDIKDYSGLENHGINKGAVPKPSQGKINGAYEFKNNQYIEIPYSDKLLTDEAFTVETWVKYTDIQNISCCADYPLINKIERWDKKSWSLRFTWNQDPSFTIYDSDNNEYDVHKYNWKLEKNKWYHVVGIYNGTHPKLYINGVEIQKKIPALDKINVLNFSILIGDQRYYCCGNFTMLLDEVRIYNYPLSLSEIQNHYNLNYEEISEPPPKQCVEDWQCSDWSICTNNEQTRACTDNNACGTITNKPVEQQSCIINETCVESWECDEWGDCINNLQTRTCNDINNCGTEFDKPILQKPCIIECVEEWKCVEWSDCSNNKQTRTCFDINDCGTFNKKPSEEKSCEKTCVEDWSCSEWQECYQGVQKRECTDNNYCGTQINRPLHQRDCECVLEKAYWTKTEARNRETVKLVIENHDCKGKLANIEIIETDGMFGSKAIYQKEVIIDNNKLSVEWEAVWEDDNPLPFFKGDPEYIFKVNVNPEIISQNILTVYEETLPLLEDAGIALTPSESAAVIQITTDVLSNATVRYGLSPSLGSEVIDTVFSSEHTLILAPLQPETTYYYQIEACDNIECEVLPVRTFTTEKYESTALIIDHTAIEEFDQIPEEYITDIYNIKFHHSGRSHSRQINEGLKLLELSDSRYNVGINEYAWDIQNPEWSIENNALKFTWIHSYLPDYSTYVSRLADANYSMFTWCGEGTADTWEQTFNDYITIMENLEQQHPDTTFIYTTMNAEANCWQNQGLNRHNFNERIRQYVRDNDKILFDFADIESYGSDNIINTLTCNSTNILFRDDEYNVANGCPGREECGPTCQLTHSNNPNCERKGKAIWYMLARLSDWDGTTAGVCTDADNDGYSVEGGSCGPIDCNDNNNIIYPGATEICNNIDDNCNNNIDENLQRDCSLNYQGICTIGTETCSAGVWSGCPLPQTETCGNGIDEDCDGVDLLCQIEITNILQNGDFELGNAQYWAGITDADITTAEVHSGNYAAHITGQQAYQRWISVTPGRTYVLSGWVKWLEFSGNDWGYDRLYVNDRDYTTLATINNIHSSYERNKWNKLALTFTATTDSVQVNFGVYGPQDNVEMYFDDLMLFEKTSNIPPTINPTSDINSGNVPLIIQFYANGDDVDGAIEYYNWDFGEGSVSRLENPMHTYVSRGTYIVNLTVWDNDGVSLSQTITIQVNDNSAPTISITSPGSSEYYTTSQSSVTLSGSAQSSSGNIVEIVWDNINTDEAGILSISPSSSFSWTTPEISLKPGKNEILITATDDQGRIDTDKISIYRQISGPTVSNIHINTDSVRVYEKYEINFDLETVAENYFFNYDINPPKGVSAGNGVTVEGIFTTPTGQVLTQPGFYYKEVINQNGVYEETGNENWVVRFSPQEIGQYEVSLRVQDASDSVTVPVGTFNALAPVKKGFIKVSEEDPRYFEFSNGDLFWPLGHVIETDYSLNKGTGLNLERPWMGGRGAYSTNWAKWISTAEQHGNEGYMSRLNYEYHYPSHELSREIFYPSGYRIRITCWLDENFCHNLKPNTNYQIKLRLKTFNISGPVDPSRPYGFVVKQSNWWSSADPIPSDVLDRESIITPVNVDRDWHTIVTTYTTSSSTYSEFNLYLENVNSGQVYIDQFSVREILPDESLGQEQIRQSKADMHIYVEQRPAAYFDWQVQQGEENDVFFKYVVHDKNDWIQNHLTDIGIFHDSGDGYYQNEDTKARWLLRQWYRYLIARWGYSTAIHSWELNNEGPPNSESHWRTTQEFAKFMHDNDAHPHLATTSFWSSWVPEFWGDNVNYPDVDYADIHEYSHDNFEYTTDVAFFHSDVSNRVGQSAVGKPVIRGETGLSEPGNNLFNYLTQPNPGIWFHNLIWAQLNSGGMFDPNYWWSQHRGQIDSAAISTPFYLFIQNLDINKGGYVDVNAQISNANLRVYGQKNLNKNKAHMWIQNRYHTWRNVMGVENPHIISQESGTITIQMNPSTTYRVEWWDTYNGGVSGTENLNSDSSGNLVLTITDLYDDVAVKITSTTDTFPPVRSNGQPSEELSSGTTQTIISLYTDESATCRYSTTSGQSYGSMSNTFSTSDNIYHSTTVFGLQDGQTYRYYVRCQDTNNNVNNNDYIITFSIAQPLICTDSDNDGYSVEGGACGPIDCNDNNQNIYPGAIEICNNIDDDCNNNIDENLQRDCSLNYQGICATGTETCSAGVWSGCPLPQTETCGNGIDEDCNGVDLVCSCQLTNAYWSRTIANEDSIVTITVEGDSCNGEQLNFEVWEDDLSLGEQDGDDPVSIQPLNSVFSGNTAISTWRVEWQPDCAGLCNPPEYYFIASLVSDDTVTIKSNNQLQAQQGTQVNPNDWPQLQRDPQRTGRTSLSVLASNVAKWIWVDEDHITHNFVSEPNTYINYPQRRDVILAGDVQPIVAENKIFFGTTNGEFYALNAEDASTIWKQQLGGAILHTAAYSNGIVVTGNMNHNIYAFDANSGQQLWAYETDAGISVAPLLMNDVVYIGSRDGYFYALDLYTGQLRWRYYTVADYEDHPHSGAPIMQSAASDGSRIFFGAENMYFYALDANTGTELWRKKLEGQSFMYSWPVVYLDPDGNNNIVMTFVMVPFGKSEQLWEDDFDALPNITQGESRADYAARVWPLERAMIRDKLANYPEYKNFHVMRTNDGSYPYAEEVPMGRVGGLGYPGRSPVIDNQDRILMYWRTKSATYLTQTRFGSKWAPDISAMNPDTGDRIWIDHDTGSGVELDNNHVLTVGGDWLYYNNHMRGSFATNLETGEVNKIANIMAIWDGTNHRWSGGNWGYQIIYWGNDDDPDRMGSNLPPPSIHRSPQGDSGVVIAEVNGRPIMFIQESGHYQINFGAITAIEGS